MKAFELNKLGIPHGTPIKSAFEGLSSAALAGLAAEEMRAELLRVIADPGDHLSHDHFGPLATVLLGMEEDAAPFVEREEPAPFLQWGDNLEEIALKQMQDACRLPVSVRGALMPDAHMGYGLPIGGVLATRGAVIPYAVGMDIACRMKLSILDMPIDALEHREDDLRHALAAETRFGIGASFKKKRNHAVLDDDWDISPVTRKHKDKAWNQLGTSGSGNHFAEFGVIRLDEDALGVKAGKYLALLSHSGSRGTGGHVAKHYSDLAAKLRPGLPKEMQNLAWLDLDSEAGIEYWGAMELMGRYAAANHALIHQHVSAQLGAEVLADVENHHNFAWKETLDGEEVVVHRKGATPATRDVLGVIPGSMATPAYVVRGKGQPESLESASHGAGRAMSRKAAKKKFSREDLQAFLDERGVTLISGGIDECPMAYKDIEEVMAAQSDLVEIVAVFEPKLVKMASD
jgi:tRNA-splicing ligase RtcB